MYWPILTYSCTCLWTFHVFILVATINSSSVWLIDYCIARINLATCGVAHTSRFSGLTNASMALSSFISKSTFPSQPSSLVFRLSKSSFQFSEFLVLEMHSGALYSSLSAGWKSVLISQQIFDHWARPLERSSVDITGVNVDHSDNSNTAPPSGEIFDQHASMISSVSKMYHTGVLCMFWAWNSFCVAHRFWLPCYISKMSWTLVILCKFCSAAWFLHCKVFSVSIVSNAV